jgi:hypothetical protein
MLAAPSETRNTAASAQSSAVIGRPSGCDAPTEALLGGDVQAAGRHEPGVGHAGRADGVDPDAELGALDGDAPGDLVDPALGGAVDGAAPADQAGDRPGVEDDTATAL